MLITDPIYYPMATSPATSDGTSDGSDNNFFDDPDADVILRSCDSREFRVLKLSIIRRSPVLKRLIQEATVPPGSGTPLPVVKMFYSGAILSSLFTFIFPMSPTLPTLSVLSLIRGSIALQDPPFIHQENAFHVYSLARKHELRQEVAEAARITLNYPLNTAKLEGKLDIMPGAYLYGLWKYHHGVQANISADILEFRTSRARGTLLGLKCVELSAALILPHWIDDYICSTAEASSSFDLVEFKTALARHNDSTQCTFCKSIPSQTVAAFCLPLINLFMGVLKRWAESALWEKPAARGHIDNPPTALPLPTCLDTSGADIIVRSSDNVYFPLHQSILASSSQILTETLSHRAYDPKTFVNGLPVMHVSEKAEIFRGVLALLAATQKYDMFAAHKNNLLPEAKTAARLTLNYPLTFEFLGPALKRFEGCALRDLAKFRKSCRDSLVSCFQSFLDTRNGPSKVWRSCSNLEAYLEALRVHIQASGGCSCSTIHALEGEKYCVSWNRK
ncbi:hypothetical protein BGW80DRAFT_1293369 [Lactifluus volemus]|nr:hypothetical protein BGW80DRAFT_1293369 [Lactifluus volemus]